MSVSVILKYDDNPTKIARQHFAHYKHPVCGLFSARAINYEVNSPKRAKFEHVLDFMAVLDICKFHNFRLNLNRLCSRQGQICVYLVLQTENSDLAGIRTCPRFYVYPDYLQVSFRSNFALLHGLLALSDK